MQWGTELKNEGGKKHLRVPFHMQWGTKLLLTNLRTSLRKPKNPILHAMAHKKFYSNKAVRTTGKSPISHAKGC